jgi:PAS domain S-box-containing protein
MPVETEHPVPRDRTDPHVPFSDRSLTIIFGAIATLLGVFGIAGLFFNIVFLSGVLPGFKPIGVLAALAWIFFGLILAIHAKKPLKGARLSIITALLVMIAITAALELPLKLMGRTFLVEDVVNSMATRFMSGQITPVSPVATFFIILSAIALFLVLRTPDFPDNPKAQDSTSIIGFSIVLMSFTVLLSYGFGAPFLYKTTIIPIAFTSALAAFFIGLGLITTAGSSSMPLRYLSGPTIRARLLRSFLPLIVIIILTQGLLQAILVSFYHVDNAILVSTGLMIFCLITAYVVGRAADEVGRLLEREEEKRRKTEGLLHESEETFRALAENANDGIMVAVGPGVHVFANRRAAEITGYSVDELVKLRIRDLSHPDEFTRREQERYKKILAGEPVETQYETFIVKKDGKNVPIEVTSAKTDWKGQSSDLVLIRDISARRQAEEALRESEEKYRILFSRMIEGNALHEVIYDSSGNPAEYRILDVNPAFERILGLQREDVIGKTSREAYDVETPPFLEIYARVAATGQPEVFETYFAPMKKHFSISVYSPGKGRFATIFEDITKRKQAEEVRESLIHELGQKNAELERFTYTVSHDLRSPLITIHGFTGLLESDVAKNDKAAISHDLDRITTAATKMEELLHDLLNLSRIGKVVNPPEEVSFTVIGKEAVELLEMVTRDRNIQVVIDPDMPVVMVDRARVREAVMNLVENSAKFMGDQQHPEIRVGAEFDSGKPVFFVRDNGIGIDPKYFGKLFNLFEKLDAKKEGSGIGLAIVKRIVEVHGGRIWVESDGKGTGCTFWFTLPS